MSDVVMTNAEVLIALRTFGTAGTKTIPNVKANYALAKARRKLTETAKDIDTTRLELCEKYAARNEDGTAKKTTVRNDLGEDVEGFDLGEHAKAFADDYNALLALSETLDGVRSVTTDELAGASLTNDELTGLGPLVTE